MLQNEGDRDHGPIANSQLLISGGDTLPFLKPTDQSFRDVAAPLGPAVVAAAADDPTDALIDDAARQAGFDHIEGAGTRTQDQRIKSPLLYQLSYASLYQLYQAFTSLLLLASYHA